VTAVVDEMRFEHDFLGFLWFPLLISVLLLPQTQLSPFSKVCSRLGQVAHYLIICLKVWGVIPDQALGRLKYMEFIRLTLEDSFREVNRLE
jgi:hypothetical protein